MKSDYFKNACIVGFGRHAENKIIPALKKAKINLKVIVTKKNNLINSVTTIESIYKSVNYLDKNTLIIICSPPSAHYKQIIFYLEKGYSVLVEKPIVLTNYQINNILKIREKNNNILIENFMYEYTKIFKNNLDYLKNNKSKIHEISVNFLIPKLKFKSFRSINLKQNSFIYDIGSYIASYLSHLKIKLPYKNKINLKMNKNKNVNMFLNFKYHNINININFGYSSEYKNKIIFKKNNEELIFDYFFYGIEKNKKIYSNTKKNRVLKSIEDNNGFVSILKKSKKYWIKSQGHRDLMFIRNTKLLEKLIKYYYN